MSFVPCAQCRRHVQALASACPFCGTGRVPGEPPQRAVAGRLRRSALLALGASAVLTGCSDNNVVAVYGAPSDGAVDTAVSDTGTSDGGTSDTGTSDTGTSDGGTSDAGDAGADTRETGVAPPYGIPPSDAG